MEIPFELKDSFTFFLTIRWRPAPKSACCHLPCWGRRRWTDFNKLPFFWLENGVWGQALEASPLRSTTTAEIYKNETSHPSWDVPGQNRWQGWPKNAKEYTFSSPSIQVQISFLLVKRTKLFVCLPCVHSNLRWRCKLCSSKSMSFLFPCMHDGLSCKVLF